MDEGEPVKEVAAVRTSLTAQETVQHMGDALVQYGDGRNEMIWKQTGSGEQRGVECFADKHERHEILWDFFLKCQVWISLCDAQPLKLWVISIGHIEFLASVRAGEMEQSGRKWSDSAAGFQAVGVNLQGLWRRGVDSFAVSPTQEVADGVWGLLVPPPWLAAS